MAKRPTKSTGKAQRALGEAGVSDSPPPAQAKAPAPIALSAVLGQDRAVGVMQDALRSGKVHHAWTFHGPVGVGKFTAALAFAACLLDPTTDVGMTGEIAPDPSSKVQAMLRGGAHPDLTIVTRETAKFHDDKQIRDRKQTTIPIDVVRKFVLEPGALSAQVSPGGAAAKVFIIDEAELLGIPAQNALLKFLEEPPARTVLMLVTSNPELLLPTIRSRCQRVGFVGLSQGAMQQWLKGREVDLAPAQRGWLVDFCAGSPGAFVRAHETGIHAWWARLEPMLLQAEQGTHVVELGPLMHELTDTWAKAWVEVRENASKESANGAAAEWMFRVLAWRFGLRLRGAVKGGADTGAVLAQIDALRAAETELDNNVSPQFVMEKLAAEVAACARGEAVV
jgi:DNA polymerase-3 subunit delta'